jgi:hypothetical protein
MTLNASSQKYEEKQSYPLQRNVKSCNLVCPRLPGFTGVHAKESREGLFCSYPHVKNEEKVNVCGIIQLPLSGVAGAIATTEYYSTNTP